MSDFPCFNVQSKNILDILWQSITFFKLLVRKRYTISSGVTNLKAFCQNYFMFACQLYRSLQEHNAMWTKYFYHWITEKVIFTREL